MKKFTMFVIYLFAAAIFMCSEKAVAGPPPSIDCAEGGCTVEYTSTETICEIKTRSESELPNDSSFNYPYGLFEFTIGICPVGSPASTGRVKTQRIVSGTMDFYFKDSNGDPIDMTGYIYRKYGLEPVDDPNTPINETITEHWYDFMWDGQTGAQISGNRITLSFIDGQRGDDDITENNIIVDQGGPGNNEIPTMTEWGMIIFLLFAGVGAILYMRKHRKTA